MHEQLHIHQQEAQAGGGSEVRWGTKWGTKKKLKLFKVLVATIDAQWEGMGDVGSARSPMPDHKGFKLQ